MPKPTFSDAIEAEVKGLIEVFVPEFVRELKSLIGQWETHEARTDAEKIAAFEALARGQMPWQMQVDPVTGQPMGPNPEAGYFWTLSLPYLSGVKGLIDSGQKIMRDYLAAKQRQAEQVMEEDNAVSW